MKKFILCFAILIAMLSLASCDIYNALTHTHEFGEWVTVKEATLAEDGVAERVCECGEKETQAIKLSIVQSSEGLEYTLNDDGKSYSVSGVGSCNDTEINIPVTHDGMPVTGISDRAFFYHDPLVSLSIPDSVTSIGDGALSGCTSLTGIYVSEKNLAYKSIDGVLYTKSGEGLVQYPIGSEKDKFIIPDGVVSIAFAAFSECDNLTEIVMPDSVIEIGAKAFENCRNLTSINISESVSKIGEYVFSACSSLTSVNIPDGVSEIGEGAFSICKSLKSVKLPDNLFMVGEGAFSYCSSLESVEIPEGDIVFDGENIPEDAIVIYSGAFAFCSSLRSIDIPNNVIAMGNEVFKECVSLTKATIGKGLVEMGDRVFWGCKSLTRVDVLAENQYYTSIDGTLYTKDLTHLMAYAPARADSVFVIPEGVERIDNSAFYNCQNLTSVTIPEGVTDIGVEAFLMCVNLTDVTLPDSLIDIGQGAFISCYSIKEIVIPDGVMRIRTSAFASCTSLVSVTIPESVVSIEYSAFYNCKSLASVTIPTSIFFIGDEAFRACSSLKSVDLGDLEHLEHFGTGVFAFCTSLESVVLPADALEVSAQIFYECTSLESVTILGSAYSIGEQAFQKCHALRTINYNGTKEQWEAASKGLKWNKSTDGFIVYCTDGEVVYEAQA